MIPTSPPTRRSWSWAALLRKAERDALHLRPVAFDAVCVYVAGLRVHGVATQALDIRRDVLHPDNQLLGMTHDALADAFGMLGGEGLARAVPHCEAALRVRPSTVAGHGV